MPSNSDVSALGQPETSPAISTPAAPAQQPGAQTASADLVTTFSARLNLQAIIGLIALISALFSGFFWIDSRYAQNRVMKKIEQRLDLKITNDQLQNAREQIWKLQERVTRTPTDKTASELIRSLQVKVQELEKEVEHISQRETN